MRRLGGRTSKLDFSHLLVLGDRKPGAEPGVWLGAGTFRASAAIPDRRNLQSSESPRLKRHRDGPRAWPRRSHAGDVGCRVCRIGPTGDSPKWLKSSLDHPLLVQHYDLLIV